MLTRAVPSNAPNTVYLASHSGAWNWTATAAIAGIASVLVVLFFNLKSQKLTRDGQKQERELAESSAARSEAAARLTESYTQRVVDALEAMARAGVTGTVPAPPRVAWSMRHHSGDTYILENVGDAKAWNVALDHDESLWLQINEGSSDLGPGEALTFMASRSMGTRDSTITVTWDDDEDGSYSGGEWKYPLPARPR